MVRQVSSRYRVQWRLKVCYGRDGKFRARMRHFAKFCQVSPEVRDCALGYGHPPPISRPPHVRVFLFISPFSGGSSNFTDR